MLWPSIETRSVSFEVARFDGFGIAMPYAEGVADLSPGLRSYPGTVSSDRLNPEGQRRDGFWN
jgi:hypothetical protein